MPLRIQESIALYIMSPRRKEGLPTIGTKKMLNLLLQEAQQYFSMYRTNNTLLQCPKRAHCGHVSLRFLQPSSSTGSVVNTSFGGVVKSSTDSSVDVIVIGSVVGYSVVGISVGSSVGSSVNVVGFGSNVSCMSRIVVGGGVVVGVGVVNGVVGKGVVVVVVLTDVVVVVSVGAVVVTVVVSLCVGDSVDCGLISVK